MHNDSWKVGDPIISPVAHHREIRFADLSQQEKYHTLISTVVPRPIAWVSTISDQGVGNLAPFSFFNALCSNPPCVMFSVANSRTGKKHTLRNIEATKEFVINLSPSSLLRPMHHTSDFYPDGVDELLEVGLSPLDSSIVKPKRIKESPVHLECTLLEIKNFGGDSRGGANVIFGEVIVAHIWEEALQDGKVIFEKLSPLGRLGGVDYMEPGKVVSYPEKIK